MKTLIQANTELLNLGMGANKAQLLHCLSETTNRLKAVMDQARAQFRAGDNHATFNKQTINTLNRPGCQGIDDCLGAINKIRAMEKKKQRDTFEVSYNAASIQMGKYHLIHRCCSIELWDVFAGEKEVGFLRLRHNCFVACVTIASLNDPKDWKFVYQSHASHGKEYFEYAEREHFLLAGVKAIDEALES